MALPPGQSAPAECPEAQVMGNLLVTQIDRDPRDEHSSLKELIPSLLLALLEGMFLLLETLQSSGHD